MTAASAIPCRRFGRTELAMPVLSLGGMRYQQSWSDLPPDQITEASQNNLCATLEAAVAAGMHHIETARHYGSSERQLAPLLAALRYTEDGLVKYGLWEQTWAAQRAEDEAAARGVVPHGPANVDGLAARVLELRLGGEPRFGLGHEKIPPDFTDVLETL
jgi:hypothetical protein